MKPLRHLWPAIESVPGLKAVKVEWAHRLSGEYKLLRTYLVVTNDLATCYPALDQGEPRQIVSHAADDFAAICPAGGAAIELRRTDLLIHRFDGIRFAKAVGKLLGASGSPAPVADVELAWRVGTLPVDLGARPIYMAIPSESAALVTVIDVIAAASRRPFLLLAPTRRCVNAAVESRLDTTGGAFFALCDLIQLGAEGHLQIPTEASKALGAMLGVNLAADAAANVFQLRGDKWQLSFDGTTKFVNDSAGLHYIACLLREPRRIIPVPILHEMVTGIPADAIKGTSEPYFTTETHQNYRSRLEQLREDRMKAEKNSDSSWLTRIDKETEQIEIELSYNLGLHNNIRERSEYLKVKRKIAEYIRRGKTAVSKRHSVLGLHLENSIKTRGGFRYESEQEHDWLT